MNSVNLIGRLVADPEVRWTSGEKPIAVARYKLAVDRKFKREGKPKADFISCIAFGKNAEFAKKYLTKGVKIAVEGSIRTGSYTNKDGDTVYTTDVEVESHEFCESRKAGAEVSPAGGFETPQNGFGGFSGGYQSAPDFAMLEGEDGQLPF